MPESRSYGKTCRRLAAIPPAGCIVTTARVVLRFGPPSIETKGSSWIVTRTAWKVRFFCNGNFEYAANWYQLFKKFQLKKLHQN